MKTVALLILPEAHPSEIVSLKRFVLPIFREAGSAVIFTVKGNTSAHSSRSSFLRNLYHEKYAAANSR